MIAALTLLAIAMPASADSSYKSELERWRAAREARLKSDTGWLTVAGLFWLKEGDNPVGASEKDTVVLPPGSAAEQTGTITLRDGRVHIALEPTAHAKVNGKLVQSAELRSDMETNGKPDTVTIGDRLSFFVIKRGTRFGIRLKDKQSEYRRSFKGLSWYPVDPAWRLEAKWVAYPQPKKLVFDSMTGDKQEDLSPGYAVFTAGGREFKLEATTEDDTLFFVFRDKTAGKTTYGAGRMLNTPMPQAGKVILDFNKAYNPPCVFTPYATCPLPVPENRLPIEIPAGELKYIGNSH